MINDKIDPDADRDFLTQVPPEWWDNYYFALGKFMHMFARMENNLNAQISNFISFKTFPKDKKGPFVIRAILGGQRMKPARETIMRLLRVIKNYEEKKQNKLNDVEIEVNRIFKHLGDIQYLRDRIAHNGASPNMTTKEGWFYTANSITVREHEKANIIYFKSEMLLNAARDLEIIPTLLSKALEPIIHGKAFSLDPSIAHLQPVLDEYYAEIRWPWHYRPSQLRHTCPRPHPNPE